MRLADILALTSHFIGESVTAFAVAGVGVWLCGR